MFRNLGYRSDYDQKNSFQQQSVNHFFRWFVIDDLDRGQTTIVGDRSVFTGLKPEIVQCADEKEEAKRIASWAKELIQDGFASYEICVTPYKPAIRTALQVEGIPTF
ncbi:MAG: hypothetical protein V7K21_27225 [Nostoc sp.]|uniref:hypothetical protein n=1 Tax=Nostoc sp. TaxID=1180 RepID=UPI002FF5D5B4